MNYPFTTQAGVRKTFWITHPEFKRQGRKKSLEEADALVRVW